MSYAIARSKVSNADANRLHHEDRAVHDWYRFILSFPPHLVRQYLDHFQLGAGAVVLDPFCGTGTTVVECQKRGIMGVGIEGNPMAHFAATVKTSWQIHPERLWALAEQIAATAYARLADAGLEDSPLLAGSVPAIVLRDLPAETSALLLANSISPLPLHKALLLKELIMAAPAPEQACLRLAFAKALVSSISNLHFGPEVGLGAIKPDAAVVGPWLANVRAIRDDLIALRDQPAPQSQIHRGDARTAGALLAPASIDAVITSPPYPNEKDYTRTTRLESVLLDFVGTKAELRAMKQGLVRSNTRGVYKADTDDAWIADLPRVHALAEQIEQRRIELGKTSGFERLYARVTRLYFGGMAQHLASLRPALRPGARLAYVVGDQASYFRVMIRTGEILAEIAANLGYTVSGIDLFRTRIATATREQMREEVVLLQWPG
jgi:hypothetical protein